MVNPQHTPSGNDDGGGMLRRLGRLPLSVAHRRTDPYRVTLAGVAAEVLLAVLLSRFGHHEILGLAGAGAVLIGLVAAVLGGPWAGLATTTAGALAFWVFISDTGQTSPTYATIIAALLWVVSVSAAGAIADALRRESAARRRADLETAALHRRLESALLPLIPPETGGCAVTTLYRPGEERLGLGGDFYDLQVLADGGLALVIGDVSGHGPDSAALGAALRAAWRGLVQAGVEPAKMVSSLGRIVESEATAKGLFATAWFGWVDGPATALRMGCLGHPPPLLLAGETEFLEAHPAPPLGALPEPVWLPYEVPLPSAWSLVLYTDGLIEGRAAPGSAERFGMERLRDWFAARGGSGADIDGSALRELVADLETVNGGALPDDLAVVVVARRA